MARQPSQQSRHSCLYAWLPPWARAGEPVHWWCRATVSADGAVSFWDDDGSPWLAENGL